MKKDNILKPPKKCIYCYSDAIYTTSGPFMFGDNLVKIKMKCFDCREEWDELYSLYVIIPNKKGGKDGEKA